MEDSSDSNEANALIKVIALRASNLAGGVQEETFLLELREVGSRGRAQKGILGRANFGKRREEEYKFGDKHHCKICKGGN